MGWGIVAPGAVLAGLAELLIYLTWLLFSRAAPRISKSGVFTLWIFVLMLTTLVLTTLIVFLKFA